MAPVHSDQFIVPVEPAKPERLGWADLYGRVDSAAEARPAVVFVHGGPIVRDGAPKPRDWPLFRGYAALIAAQGLVGVMFDHPLHDLIDYPRSAQTISEVVDRVRAENGVDPDRIALWAFSGAGLFAAGWLGDQQPWLRCVALTYPVVEPLPGWTVDARFRSVAVSLLPGQRIVLTRVGMEAPEIAAGVEAFVTAAGQTDLSLIDLPESVHGFDHREHTEHARRAVRRAVGLVAEALQPAASRS